MDKPGSRRPKFFESHRALKPRDRLVPGRRAVTVSLCLMAAGLGPVRSIGANGPGDLEGIVPRPGDPVTFTRHIAPLVFEHCSPCHRPGQSAPFSLLTYPDVKKHEKEILDVTTRGYMPPWLPESGYGRFASDRRLSREEIGLIQKWVAEGAREGDPADLPTPPQWAGEWQLGEPDLVLTMPHPYLLPAEGKDVYRSFVIPAPLAARRFVRAVEFRPGNPRIVHHAFIRIDPTRQSRRLEEKDGQPGFPGMRTPDGVQMPEGHFLAWQPGKISSPEPDGLSWTLEKDSDFVLQLHLRPSGKPEVIQSKVGLYFTEVPPTNSCFKLDLTCLTIDIPPGSTNYLVQDDFVLPADAHVLAVLPHAHYLCREMQGYATLPDGTRKWLLLIRNWDFNWQGDYRYATPEFLPKGTKLSMRYTFDNSTNNVRNPNHPPERVTYGPQTTDEMAELWFQLLPRNRVDQEALAQEVSVKMRKIFFDYGEYLVRTDSNNVKGHLRLAIALLAQGNHEAAQTHLRKAVQVDPKNDQPHYYLGLAFRQQRRFAEAQAEFENALRLNPDNYKAHGNLGLIFEQQGNLELAASHFRSALRINPDDSLARESLNELLKAKPKLPGNK